MSIRTIIEINHDQLNLETASDLLELLRALRGSEIPGRLNAAAGAPVGWPFAGSGIQILAQRHHSETLQLEVK